MRMVAAVGRLNSVAGLKVSPSATRGSAGSTVQLLVMGLYTPCLQARVPYIVSSQQTVNEAATEQACASIGDWRAMPTYRAASAARKRTALEDGDSLAHSPGDSLSLHLTPVYTQPAAPGRRGRPARALPAHAQLSLHQLLLLLKFRVRRFDAPLVRQRVVRAP